MTKEVRSKYSQYKSRAKRKNIEFTITLEQFAFITSLKCWYCKREFPDKGVGIDRAWNNMGYVPINCAPCCWDCNRAKSNMSRVGFYKYRKLLLLPK